jgi:hypothetical protein
MTIKLGNKADGDDFFDRVNERKDLWSYLQGNHIVLSGPRRLGKTSLLQKLADEAEEHGLLARLADMEGIDTAAGFIAELDRTFPDASIAGHLASLSDKATSLLNRMHKVNVTLPGGAGAGLELKPANASWIDAAHSLQQRLSFAPVLLLIDEVSVALEKILARDKDEAVQLISWLRTWRQQSGLACRFLFSGSIGLNALLDRYQLNTYFNDCYDFRLEAFKQKHALAMLTEQCRREDWQVGPETLSYLCQRVGWLSPFFLNLLLANTWEAARDRLEETDVNERCLLHSDVDDAYDRLLANGSRFRHWYKRLERDLEPDKLAFTLAILSAIAKSEAGLTQRQLSARLQRLETDLDQRAARLDQSLLLLEEDGYLDTSGDRIQFLSFLLRDYWKNNHAR